MLHKYHPDHPEIRQKWDALMKKPTLLRWILEGVDWEGIHTILAPAYHETLGTPAYCPTVLFRYQLLKKLFALSDSVLLERCETDAYFRMFLGLSLDNYDGVINGSTLSRFRTKRLKQTPDIIEFFISLTLDIARKEGVEIGSDIVFDATHTHAKYKLVSEAEYVQKLSRALRRSIYQEDESYSGKFIDKPKNSSTSSELEYTKQLLNQIDEFGLSKLTLDIENKVDYLAEIVDDWEKLCEVANDGARCGKKSKDENFHGWKTHYALSTNRIIVGAAVSSGERSDCQYVTTLVEMIERCGVGIHSIIGDRAYSTTPIFDSPL